MKLFVGLGNPGEKYRNTRHNAGWIVLKSLCMAEGFTDFLRNKKFQATLATGMIGKWQVIAAQPQTFMNRSGQSVQSLMQYYKLDINDLLIIQDDIDLPFGKIKLKFGGSHGGHNGIRDIISKCGTEKFWRLKLGIGRPAHPEHDIADYVLNTFSATELKRWEDHEKEVRERVGEYLRNTG